MSTDVLTGSEDRDALVARRDELQSQMPRQSWWPVSLIVIVGAIDYADRAILGVVLEDIKLEFGVGDGALGTLVSIYVVLLTLSAIPFGVLADRWNRVKLISLGFIPWTIGTALQGLATSFPMLVAARSFLGSIEATNGPSAQSLLGDYYLVERRSKVFGIWRAGDLLGVAVGTAAAAFIAGAFGWRAPFLVFAVLGLVSAAAVALFLREPPRGVSDALYRVEARLAEIDGKPPQDDVELTDDDEAPVGWREVVRHLLRIRTAWVLVIASGMGELFFSGIGAWTITYFRRFFDLSETEATTSLGVVLVAALAGTAVGSGLGDRIVRRGGRRRRIQLTMITYPSAAVFGFLAFETDSLNTSLAMLGVCGFLLYLAIPSIWAMWIDVVPAHLRGSAGSVFSIAKAGFIALGPALVGWISDATDLRTGILWVMPSLLISGLVLGAALRSYPRDALRAQQMAEGLTA